METATFNIPALSCSSCSGKIQEEIKSIKGIESISVDLKSQTINVQYNPMDIKPQDIRKKISSMGFEVMQ